LFFYNSSCREQAERRSIQMKDGIAPGYSGIALPFFEKSFEKR
jgi:hypothetical protein